MRVSVVTVSFNAADTIGDTLESVACQTHPDIEHIIVDGGSTDDTVAIARTFPHVGRIVSESDAGLYDAMNKGWGLATGELIGWLNADDMLADSEAIARIVAIGKGASLIAGSIDMVSEDDTDRVVRHYSSAGFKPSWLKFGYAPPHPGFYLRRALLEQIGGYDLSYPLTADFDLIARAIHKEKLPYVLVPETVVKMRVGGRSSGLKATRQMFDEHYQSCVKNGIRTSRAQMLFKYVLKSRQYFST